MTEGKKSLRNMVSGDLRIRLDNIWVVGKKSYHEFIKGATIQGSQHSNAIEENLERLIPDKKKKDLKPLGCFLLSASACLHDLGKVVQDDHPDWSSNHGKRSAQIILKQYPDYGLERAEAVAIAYIISVHDDGKLDELPVTPFAIGCKRVNLVELAAIFRLGDMLDTSSERAPENVSKIIFPQGDVPSIWLGRQAISGWYLDNAGRIVLQAEPKSNEELEAVFATHRWTKEDLIKISANLKIYGFPAELGELDIKEVFSGKTPTKGNAKWKPLPGMGYYTREDADMFKGRQSEIYSLISMICYRPVSLLVGESGSGKTSLINAGLFPRLESMGWKCLMIRPFDDPQENIKKVLWQMFFQESLDPKKSLFDIFKETAQKVKPQKLLITIDQFEEILNCTTSNVLDELVLALTAVQAGTIIPNLKVLISFREDSRIRLNSKILNKVAGSAQRFPTLELQGISREGAKEAMLAVLENVGVGFDPNSEGAGKPLVEIVLDDLQSRSDLIYPPFLQMVLESLFIRVADRNPPIITLQVYLEELKGSDVIIANYLTNQLKEFGDEKDRAKELLIALTSSDAKKTKKSLSQLSLEIETSLERTKTLVNKMVFLRMVRPLSGEEYELIHDFLGKIVNEKLVGEEVRTIKFLQEQLDGFQQAYKVNKTLINQPVFMATLYRNRRKIKVSEDKYALILGSSLLQENGSVWYFLKDLKKQKMCELLKEQTSHPYSKVRKRAIEFLSKIDAHGNNEIIITLLHDKDFEVRKCAVEVVAKMALPQNREIIIKLLQDQNPIIRRIAVDVLAKLALPQDREFIIKHIQDTDYDVRRSAIKALVKIALPQDREIIIRLLQAQDYDVRQSAVEALAKIGDRETIIKIVEQNDPIIRRIAVRAFVKVALPQDREIIVRLLEDPDPSIRRIGIEAFAKMGDKEFVIHLTKDQDPITRRIAVDVLAKLALPQDREFVIEHLQDQDYDFRDNVVNALAKLGDKESIIKLVQDQDPSVRPNTVDEFVKMGDRELIMLLTQDQDPSIRRIAVDAFMENAVATK